MNGIMEILNAQSFLSKTSIVEKKSQQLTYH